MKTAIQIAEKQIADLWSSPSDQPTYTQIFEILDRVKPIFEQQIIDAIEYDTEESYTGTLTGEQYYNQTFETNKETLK